MNDKEFGNRIREMRELAGITREEMCEDEVELSVRQLGRIEAGKSKPTFSKISYIASRLKVSLYELMPDYVQLPERYSKLKFEVLRTPTYENAILVQKRNALLAEIYDNYYDNLPEEEQIAIDAFQSIVDVFETKTKHFGKEILEDYFEQIYRKEQHHLNDLLIIRLHLEHLSIGTCKSEECDRFLSLTVNLINEIDMMDPNELFVLRDILFAFVGLLGERGQHDCIPTLFDALDKIMSISQDFQKKPILNLLKWKYELFVRNDRNQAERHYDEAILFANLIGNQHLVERIKQDWQDDIA